MDSGLWCIAALVHLWILAWIVILATVARRQRERMRHLDREMERYRRTKALKTQVFRE